MSTSEKSIRQWCFTNKGEYMYIMGLDDIFRWCAENEVVDFDATALDRLVSKGII